MRLMQLNSWMNRLDKQIVDLIHDETPDIITFQEALSSEHKGSTLLATLEQIQDRTNFKYKDMAGVLRFPMMKASVEFGNAVLTNYPPTNRATIFTSGKFVDNFDFAEDDYNVRNLQHVAVQTPQGILHVLTHHGYHINAHKNGNDATLAACMKIHDYIKDLDGPVILTGDFNLSPDSPSLIPLNSLLRNLAAETNLITTRSLLTHKNEVCDYIFVNKQINVKRFWMSDEIVSDHNALFLEFDLVP